MGVSGFAARKSSVRLDGPPEMLSRSASDSSSAVNSKPCLAANSMSLSWNAGSSATFFRKLDRASFDMVRLALLE